MVVILALYSFLNGFCLPLAPDFLLVPMLLAKQKRKMLYFFIVVISVTLGSLIGYMLGRYFFTTYIYEILIYFGYGNEIERCIKLVQDYGSLVLLCSFFIPLPFMLFAIIFGALHLSIISFILCSMLSRLIRFYLLILLVQSGEKSISIIIKKKFFAKL